MTQSSLRNGFAVGVIVLVLLLLNIVFYSGGADTGENEKTGDRSSYTGRTFGTRAFYTLLEESDYPVTRLRESLVSLERKPLGVLFIISPPSFHPITRAEFGSLTEWVRRGGRVVVIDRDINIKLADSIEVRTVEGEFDKDLATPRDLTPLTLGVEQLRLSRYASRIRAEQGSPVEQAGDDLGSVAIDFKLGNGRIIFVADPFIVANNGIAEEDNLRFALNLIGSDGESLKKLGQEVFFDEFHHGYGALPAGLVSYFRGTPMPWIAGQIVCLALLLIYSRGRRFARPIPLKRERRTSSLEFVASMAQIQRLAAASDLAAENICVRLRNRLSRYAGLPGSCSDQALAEAIGRRSAKDPRKLQPILLQAELINNGHPVKEAELLSLVVELRQLQHELGLAAGSRAADTPRAR